MFRTSVAILTLASLSFACDRLEGQVPSIQAGGWLGEDGPPDLEKFRGKALVIGYLPAPRKDLARKLVALHERYSDKAAFVGLSPLGEAAVRGCLEKGEPGFPVGFDDRSDLCHCRADSYILDAEGRVAWQGRSEQLCEQVIDDCLSQAGPPTLPEEVPDTRDFRKIARDLQEGRLGAAIERCKQVASDPDATPEEQEAASAILAALAAKLKADKGAGKAPSGEPLSVEAVLEKARLYASKGKWADAAFCYEKALALDPYGPWAEECREEAERCRAAGGKKK